MKKTYIITGAILLVAIGVTLYALLGQGGGGDVETTLADPYALVDTGAYLSHVKEEADSISPLMKSDVKDVFYTITTDGKVQFYKYADGKLTTLKETGTFDTEIELSGTTLKAKVHYYLDASGQITGYGLYTTEIYKTTNIYYQYAFFKIMNLPSFFAKTDNYLLLVDTEQEDFYKQDKLYKEPYYYNLKKGTVGERFLNEENRLAGLGGEKRADYSMLTDEVILDNDGEILFLSSRHYQLSGEYHKTDIFLSGDVSHNNDDNYRLIQNIVGNYAKNSKDGGVLYLANDGDESFSLKEHEGRKKDGKDTLIREFDGKYSDYIRSGDYLLHKDTNTLYNLYTNEEITLSAGENGFKADLFVIEAESGNIFMRGFSQSCAAIAFCSLENKELNVLYNEDFLNIINPHFASDGNFVVPASADGTSDSFKYYIFSAK